MTSVMQVNVVDADGWTALRVAVDARQQTAVRTLLENGAEIEAEVSPALSTAVKPL